jgi:hypothetical protein
MSPKDHCFVLKRLHTERADDYLRRLATAFNLNYESMMVTFRDCLDDGHDVYGALEIVLESKFLIPYERFIECYVATTQV